MSHVRVASCCQCQCQQLQSCFLPCAFFGKRAAESVYVFLPPHQPIVQQQQHPPFSCLPLPARLIVRFLLAREQVNLFGASPSALFPGWSKSFTPFFMSPRSLRIFSTSIDQFLARARGHTTRPSWNAVPTLKSPSWTQTSSLSLTSRMNPMATRQCQSWYVCSDPALLLLSFPKPCPHPHHSLLPPCWRLALTL